MLGLRRLRGLRFAEGGFLLGAVEFGIGQVTFGMVAHVRYSLRMASRTP